VHRRTGEGDDAVVENLALPDGTLILQPGDVVDVIGPDPVLERFAGRN